MESTDHSFESADCRGVPIVEGYSAAMVDVLSLLDSAERAGLRSGRAMRLRAKLERGLVLDAERMSAVEQWLRDWLGYHEAATALDVFDLSAPAVTS